MMVKCIITLPWNLVLGNFAVLNPILKYGNFKDMGNNQAIE